MEIKIKGKRGITLITLVITIILLLILAAVSVTMLTGDSGFFGKARLARENTEKAEYKEIIKMAQAEDNITTDRFRGKETKLNGIAEILNKDKKLGEGTGTQITKEYQDKENPRLVVKTKENWVYIVTVDGIKELGKVDGDIPLDVDIKNGDIKYIYEPNYWTNSDVEVSLSIAKEEYKEFKIQYSYDLKTWKDYTDKIVVENNKAIYSRITTGTSVSESYATGNVINIDKKEPQISTAMNSSNVTTKGFTVNVGVKDENSGLGKIVWYYKKSDATSYTSEEVIYKELHSTQAGETTAVIKSKTYDNLTSGTYNVYAEIYDVAGNITDANSSDKPLEITLGTVTGLTEANTTFKAEPSDWTNGKVTVTASTNVSGYTIQTTKTPTVESSWKDTASQEFTENGKIYARLWDGTNAGGYSTGNVTNIDTLAPKGFTPTATSTTKSITVSASTTDADVTSTSASSGIAGYRFKLDSGSWTEYQASGTYKWDNLAQTTNHTITVEAKDNAGNTKQGTVSKGTGTVAGLTTANTTFTANPTGWTNGKVTMTASTNVSGYTIQTTKTPTVESSWKNTASQEFTENGKIYARLWDGTNAGGYSTGNVTNIDTLAPKGFTPTATSTTKSITVNASTTDAEATETSASSGIAGYRFKLDSGSWTEYQASGTYKWDNLTQTTNHTITVEAKDNAGNTKQATATKGTGTVEGLTTANTTFTANPDTWTNGKVTMTASTNVSGYTIQTTKTPTVESSWKSTASQEFTENGKIYARLWDGTNAGGYSTGNVTNIDTLAPKGFTPTATSTTKSITVTANTTDADAISTSASSGIAGYRFKLDSGSWSVYQTSGTYKWDNLAQTTNHTITVETKDNAGNTKQGTVSKGTGTVAGLTTANTTFKANPDTWTNGKVTMTASTNVSGYTIQTTKTPTVESSWKSTASQEFTENGKIYARLWDGTNAGGYSTGNVTNIDTLAPKGFTPTATSTTKSITVSANTTDADATSTSGSSGIAGYRFKLDSGSWTEYQASGTYKWDNLTQTTNHTITVEVKDNAGNTKQVTATKGTGTVETASGATYTPTGWTNGNVTVTLPTKSGFTTRYTTNGTAPTTSSTEYSKAFTVSSNCTITYIYTDGTNIGGAGTLNVTNIDKTPPGGVTVTYNGGANSCSWKNNYNLTLSASDSQSGIKRYEIDTNLDGNAEHTTGSNFIPWNGYTSCKNRFRAVDNAGNIGDWSEQHHIHMDTTAPTIGNISSAFTIVSGNTGYITVSNVTDTGGSGIAGYYVNTVGQWVSSSSSSFSQAVTTAGTYYIYAKDNAGNVSAAKSCTVYVASAVARIGGTYFTSLGNAVNAVAANNVQTEIVLLANTNESVTIPAGKNIALNLNGKTLSYTGTPLTNNGTVSIYGGTISSNGNASDGGDIRWALLNNGTAYFLNGTIKSYGGYAARNYGTLNMSGGTFSLTGGTTHTCVFNQGTFNMSAGNITSDQYGLVTDGNGVSNVNGGSIICNSNAHAVLVRGNGTAKFSGATITQNGSGYCLVNEISWGFGRLVLYHCSYQAGKVSGDVACINGTNTYYGLRLYGRAIMENTTKVAVWSVANGQDDLIWHEVSNTGSNYKDFVIYYSQHGGTSASLYQHVYIYPSTGAQFVCSINYN